MIDLHTHSRASDGSLTPSELLKAAKKRGLSALALTDHDTIDGLEEARKEAENQGIRFIPGIELEIRWNPEIVPVPDSANGGDKTGVPAPEGVPGVINGEFHLLGLGLNEPGAAFRAVLEELTQQREDRNLLILDRIRELGIQADYGEIRAISGGGSVGRPHFASFLVNRGLVKSREQAFVQYLGKGKPLYVSKAGLEFSRALDLIREAGGIAVLAHPMSLFVSWGRLPALVAELASQGLAGIEAWHPTAKVRSCKRLEELGKSLGLFITAGSDFHGESRPDRELGVTAGDREIEDIFLEAIPPLAKLC